MSEALEIFGLERRRVRRRTQQKVTNEAALAHRVGREALVSVSVILGEPGVFPVMHIVVRVAAEVATLLHKYRASAVWRYLKSMSRQLERAEDFRAEQATYVGSVRIDPVLVEIPAHGCAADVLVFFHAEYVEASLGQEGGICQTVMACANNDGVICFHSVVSLNGC